MYNKKSTRKACRVTIVAPDTWNDTSYSKSDRTNKYELTLRIDEADFFFTFGWQIKNLAVKPDGMFVAKPNFATSQLSTVLIPDCVQHHTQGRKCV